MQRLPENLHCMGICSRTDLHDDSHAEKYPRKGVEETRSVSCSIQDDKYFISAKLQVGDGSCLHGICRGFDERLLASLINMECSKESNAAGKSDCSHCHTRCS